MRQPCLQLVCVLFLTTVTDSLPSETLTRLKRTVDCGSPDVGLGNDGIGHLVSPGWDSGGYAASTQCTWTLEGTIGKYLGITITDIDIEYSPTCDRDYLEVWDVAHDTWYGRFCGNMAANSSVIVPNNQTEVTFVSDSSNTAGNKGFTLEFQALETQTTAVTSCSWPAEGQGCVACGGEVPQTGTIQSYLYGQDNYPNNMQCTWTLRTRRADQAVLIEFEAVDVEYSTDCSADYITVSQWQSGAMVEMMRVCGHGDTPFLILDSSKVTVHFHTNDAESGAGFKLNYDTEVISDDDFVFCGFNEDPQSSCHSSMQLPGSQVVNVTYTYTFTETVSSSNGGFVSSPGYPGTYTTDLDQTWEISVGSNKVIWLLFTVLDMELSINCSADFVAVETLGVTAPVLTACGSFLLPTATLSSNRASVSFHSDAVGNGTGFMMSYEGVIADVYHYVADCTGPAADGCYLVQENGYGGYYDEYTSPPVIMSPNFPGDYPINMKAFYYVYGGANMGITMTFLALELRRSLWCHTEYVAILNGHTGMELIHLCGNDTLPAVTINSNVANVEFRTQGNVQRMGFKLEYGFLASSPGRDMGECNNVTEGSDRGLGCYIPRLCGGELTDLNGTIISPGFPESFPVDSYCIWTLHVTVGWLLTFRFGFIDVHKTSTCQRDYIEIRNGDTDVGVLRACNSAYTPQVMLTTNRATVIFRTGNANTEGLTGFQLNYEATMPDASFPRVDTADCGGGGDGSGCVTVANWYSVTVQNEAGLLHYNRVSGTGQGNQGVATNNAAASDQSQDASSAESETDTELSPTGSQGQVASSAESETNTELRPTGTQSQVASSAESETETELRPTETDPVITETPKDPTEAGPKETISPANTIKAETPDDPPVSDSPESEVEFAHTETLVAAAEGGDVPVVLDAREPYCGPASPSPPSGTIQWPLEDTVYETSGYCIWALHAQEGQQIRLTFDDFDVRTPNICEDAEFIYQTGASPLNCLVNMCGRLCTLLTDFPLVFVADGVVMQFTWFSDVSSEAKFTITYDIQDIETTNPDVPPSGEDTPNQYIGDPLYFSAPSGDIAMPTFPAGDFDRALMTWVVTGNTDQRVTLTFDNLDVETSSGCSAAQLTLQDGPYPLNCAMLSCDEICSQFTNYVWQSVNEQVVAQLDWANDVHDQVYFSMSYSITDAPVAEPPDEDTALEPETRNNYVSPPVFLTTPSGTIELPDYPSGDFDRAVHTWVISGNPGQRVRLHLDDMAMESPGGCSSAQLTLQDGAFPLDCTAWTCSHICAQITGGEWLSNNEAVVAQLDWSDEAQGQVYFSMSYDITDDPSTVPHQWGTGLDEADQDNTNTYTSTPLYLYDASGVIEILPYPDGNYERVKDTWIILGNPGQTISIHMIYIDMETVEGCSAAQLTLQDGSYPLDCVQWTCLKICFEIFDQAWMSENSEVVAQLDWTSQAREQVYFSMIYDIIGEQVADPADGAPPEEEENIYVSQPIFLNQPSWAIALPPFPVGGYDRAINTWVIDGNPGHIIMLHLNYVDMETTGGCSAARLTLQDGSYPVDCLQARCDDICAELSNEEWVTESDDAVLELDWTDGVQDQVYFSVSYDIIVDSATYEPQEEVADQGTTQAYAVNSYVGQPVLLSDPSGTIVSPPYPSGGYDHAKNTWIIHGNPGQIVLLSLNNADIETTGGCDTAQLTLQDGNYPLNCEQWQCDYFCSQIPILQWISENNQVVAQLDWTDEVQDQVYFSMTYDITDDTGTEPQDDDDDDDDTAGGTTQQDTPSDYVGQPVFLSDASGTILSPTYPVGNYQTASHTWVITGNPGQKVSVILHNADIETTGGCDAAWLILQDGNYPLNCEQWQCDYFCSQIPILQWISENNQVVAQLDWTDEVQDQVYFSMTYDITDDTGTEPQDDSEEEGETQDDTPSTFFSEPIFLNEADGTISSPSFPTGNYERASHTWVINGNPGQRVLLTLMYIDLDTTGGCGAAQLTLQDGNYPIDCSQWRCDPFCSLIFNEEWASDNSQVVAQLDWTDEVQDQVYFSMSYQITDDEADESDGDMGQPDGTQADSTSSYVGQPVFMYEPSGTITIPSYPSGYASAVHTWVISGNPDQIVSLQLSDVDLETDGGCNAAQLTIQDGSYPLDCTQWICDHICIQFAYHEWASFYNEVVAQLDWTDGVHDQVYFSISYAFMDSPLTDTQGDGSMDGTQGNDDIYTSQPVILTNPSGIITVPIYPGSEFDRSLHTWVIRGDPGQGVLLYLNMMDLYTTGGCQAAQLTLQDGSYPLNCYQRRCSDICTQFANEEWSAENNEVVVQLNWTNAVRDQVYFGMSYDITGAPQDEEAEVPQQEATYTSPVVYMGGPSGQITTPPYPNWDYPRAVHTWVIVGNPGNRILLNLVRVDLATSGGCSSAQLIIQDGGYPLACSTWACSQVCTDFVDGEWLSTNEDVVAQLEWAADVQDQVYFSMTYVMTGGDQQNTQDGDQGTGQEASAGIYSAEPVYFSAPSAAILMPNYPSGNYDRAVHTWVIIGNSGQDITLHLDNIDMESSGGCDAAQLTLQDGLYPMDCTLWRCETICTRFTNREWHAENDEVVVELDWTDEAVGQVYFSMSYDITDAESGGESAVEQPSPDRSISAPVFMTAPSGDILTPQYPVWNPEYAENTWIIKGNNGQKVELYFNYFDVETSGGCGAAQFILQDGFYPINCQVNTCNHLCSQFSNHHWVSVNEEIVAVLDWSSDVQDQVYFSITYDLTDVQTQAEASQLEGSVMESTPVFFSAPSGMIETPNYPSGNAGSAQNTWVIRGNPGQRIRVHFNTFDVETTGGCQAAQLTVQDGPYPLDCTLNACSYLCSRFTNYDWLSYTDHVVARLDWTNDVQDQVYFSLNYELVDGQTGLPQDSNNQVGSGGQSSGTIDFLTDPNGVVESPMYPSGLDWADYTWVITGNPGQRVQLNFIYMDLSTSGGCGEAQLILQDGHYPLDCTVTHCIYICSQFSGTTWESEHEEIVVRLDWNSAVQDQVYFTMSYNLIGDSGAPSQDQGTMTFDPASCGQTSLTTSPGIISSPFYPQNYPHNADCQWVLQAPNGQVIDIAIEYMSMEYSDGCMRDKLVFQDGPLPYHCNTYLTDCVTFCQPSLGAPIVFTSQGNAMVVRFTSNDDVTGPGFRLAYSWTTNTQNQLEDSQLCGNTMLAGPAGIIVSPYFLHGTAEYVDCVWQISGSPGQTIALTFDTLSMTTILGCTSAILTIHDHAPPMNCDVYRCIDFCHTVPTYNFLSTSSSIVLHYTKQSGVTMPVGFWLSYVITDDVNAIGNSVVTDGAPAGGGSCGGTFTTSGVVESPAVTAEQQTCTWLINGQSGQSIDLDFEYFNLNTNGGCSDAEFIFQDSPAVSDGLDCSSSTSYCTPLCHSFGFYERTSRSYGVVLQYTKSAGVTDDIGFRISFDITGVATGQSGGDTANSGAANSPQEPAVPPDGQSVAEVDNMCGHTHLTSSSGTITSPGYPSNYYNNDACKWFIIAPFGERISLIFDVVSVEYTQGCVNDMLLYYDGPANNYNCDNNACHRLCGMYNNYIWTSSEHIVVVEFKTNGYNTDYGFSLRYAFSSTVGGTQVNPASTTCGGTQTDPSGLITSPYYPNNYGNSMECLWVIEAPVGEVITLVFETFDLEYNIGCPEDAFLLQDGPAPINCYAYYCMTFCNQFTDYFWESHRNSVSMQFTSNDQVTDKGFSIRYTMSGDGTGNGDGSDDAVDLNSCGYRYLSFVYGGTDVIAHSWPWQGLLRVTEGSEMTLCGASLVAPSWAITAAHCVLSGNAVYQLDLGSHSMSITDTPQVQHLVDWVVYPPMDDSLHDIALLHLASAVTYSSAIAPVCLVEGYDPPPGTQCIITGWGMTEDGSQADILQQADIFILEDDDPTCRFNIDSNSFCAGGIPGSGVCSGDSGGPLVCLQDGAYTLVGITSLGYMPCGTLAGVFTRVAAYIDWIEQNSQGEIPIR